MTNKRADCLAVLGLPADATVSQARVAHCDLLQVCHPDRVGHSLRLQEQAQAKTAAINEAFQWLETQTEHSPSYDPKRSGPAAAHVEAPAVVVPVREPSPWRRIAAIVAGMVIATLLGLVLLVFRFTGDIPVTLSIETTPPTEVTVVPAKDPTGVFEMGSTPVHDFSGVFVGDTVILRNAEQGIEHQQTIKWGRPNRHVKIELTFQRGELMLNAQPNQPGLDVGRENSRLGEGGAALPLYEGMHHLTVRGAGLRKPVTFDAPVRASQRTDLMLDVTTGQVRPP